MSLLLEVHLSVPSSPGLEGSIHTTLSAHVTEGTLSTSVGTGATDSGDSGHSSTGSPGLCGVFATSQSVDSMSLSSVLGHVGVHEVDDVVSDGGSENSWHGNTVYYFTLGILGVNANYGSRGHL